MTAAAWNRRPHLSEQVRLEHARERLRAGYSLQHAANMGHFTTQELDLLLWRALRARSEFRS